MGLLLLLTVVIGVPRGCDLLWGNAPMNLYGELIDQTGKPVPDARITFDAVAQARFQMPLLTGVGREVRWKTTAMSGVDGKFAIHDAPGTTLTIESVERVGYQRACAYETFHFGRSRPEPPHEADPRHPVVFMCWNDAFKRIVQHDVTATVGLESYALAYRSGRFSKYGTGDENLAIRIVRPEGNPRAPYDWTLEIEGIDGQVVDANGPLKAQAPEGGYARTLRYSVRATDPAWASKLTVNIYSRGTDTLGMSRLYAGVNLDVVLARDGGSPTVAIHYTADFGSSPDLVPGPMTPAPK